MRAQLLLAMIASPLAAQSVPLRPEQLHFAPLVFPDPLSSAHRGRLGNGIPVFLAEDPQSSFLRVRLGIRAGAHLEPREQAGLLRLLAAQLMHGGTVHAPAAEVERRLGSLAASLDGSVTPASLDLRLKVMAKHGAEGLELLLRCALEPAFEAERLEASRRQLLEELSREREDVTRWADALLAPVLRGMDQPAPSEASLNGIRREDLHALHRLVLQPRELVVAISGRFDRKAILAQLESTLGKLKPAPGGAAPEPPAQVFAAAPGLRLVPREGSQSLVRLVLPGLPRTDPDWETAQVLNELLAGSSLGRLSRKVRTEAGLTYGIRSTLSEPTRGRGDWTCTLRTRHRSVPYALRLILAELQRLRNEPVPPAELEATIDGLVQAYPSFWSSASNRVETFATHAQAGWPADLQVRARERFRAVTPERLQAMARRLLDPSRLVVLVAGRLEEAEAGDPKDHPGTLREAMNLPVIPLTPSLSR